MQGRRGLNVSQRMHRALVGASLSVALLSVPAHTQATIPIHQMAKDATPQFEVAVIKPTDPADTNRGFHTADRHIYIENQTLLNMICFAYAVQESQVVDGPGWIGHDRFDVKGVPDVAGYPDMKQFQMMVQKLLADRFHFQFKRDQRELKVYAMTVAKSGAKIAKSDGDPNGLPDQTGYGKGNAQVMKFTNNTMAELALGMEYFLDKPVVDHTGLAGRYDFTLTWTPAVTETSEANDAPSVYTAFQEQLGLKLQPTKEPASVLVVERLERPTEN